MRVWDIHPGYLSRQSLLGQHAEIHALAGIIIGGKKGYAAHPETLRWKNALAGLRRCHDLTVLEMLLRGFKHASPFPGCETVRVTGPGCSRRVYLDSPVQQIAILKRKYLEREQSGRIPLPENGCQYWAQHKYSVMARGYAYYKDVQSYLRDTGGSSLKEPDELIERILNLLELPVTRPALANVVDHLWGYFKREASDEEKSFYLLKRDCDQAALVRYLFDLAVKYKKSYLLQSTIFADFTAPSPGIPSRSEYK